LIYYYLLFKVCHIQIVIYRFIEKVKRKRKIFFGYDVQAFSIKEVL